MANMSPDPAAVQAALDQVNSNNEQDVYKGRLALRNACAGVGGPGNEKQRADLARQLAEALINGGKYSARARCLIADELATVAGDSEIAAFESAMVDLAVRGSARWALDRTPTAAATKALVQAVDQSIGDRFRIGLVQSLGQRSGEGVVETLKRWAVEDPSQTVRLAAAEAIANHPDPSGYGVIDKVKNSSQAPWTQQELGRLWKASVRLAACLAANNQPNPARRIYHAIASSDAPEPQKKAAKIALAALA